MLKKIFSLVATLLLVFAVPLTCFADKYYIYPNELEPISVYTGAVMYLHVPSVAIDRAKSRATVVTVLDMARAPNYQVDLMHFYFDDDTMDNPLIMIVSKQTCEILSEDDGLIPDRVPVKGDIARLYNVIKNNLNS